MYNRFFKTMGEPDTDLCTTFIWFKTTQEYLPVRSCRLFDSWLHDAG
jgi:hypothetical protein